MSFKKNKFLFLVVLSLIMVSNSFAGRRPYITSFTVDERKELRTVILEWVVSSNIVQHHLSCGADCHGSNRFLGWHREHIEELESYILSKGLSKYIPLPKWDPTTCIPDEFFGADATVTGYDPMECQCPSQCRQTNNAPCPNTCATFSFSSFDIVQSGDAICEGDFYNEDQTELGFSNRLENQHDPVHRSIGGDMATFSSPGAAIFWIWHAYVDDIYEEFLCRCPDDDDDHYGNNEEWDDLDNTVHFIKNNEDTYSGFRYVTTVSTVSVPSSRNITFRAGVKIELNPGFSTQNNTNFIAFIDNCPRPGDQSPERNTSGNSSEALVAKNILNTNKAGSNSINTNGLRNEEIGKSSIEPNSIAFSLHPNPNNGTFTLTLPSSSAGYNAIIYDLLGNVIYESTLINNQSIDISNHPKGIYFIKVSDGKDFKIEKIIHQ